MIPAIPDRLNAAALGTSYATARAIIRYGVLGDHDDVLARLNVQRQDLRALEADDEIAAAIETRRDACISTPWRLEHPSDEIREAFTAALDPHMGRMMRTAWTALLYGSTFAEIVYQTRPRQAPRLRYGIAEVISMPFEWFTIQADGVALWRDTLEPLQRPKFYSFVRDGSLRKPMGEALLAKAWWPWYFRTHGWKFWSRFLEASAIPLIYGKTSGRADQLLDLLQQITTGPAIAIPDTDSLDALDPPGNSPNKFQDFEQACVRRIQRLILGQTLTSGTDGGSGNRALGEVHDRVRREKRNADIAFVAEQMQAIIDDLATLNGIAEAPAFIMGDEIGLEAERATRDATLVNAGILRFTPAYLMEKYGFEADDFEAIEPLPAPPVPPAPEADGGVPGEAQMAAAPSRYTPAQQAVEDRVSAALRGVASPIDQRALLSAIRGARSPEDLAERLAVAFTGSGDTEFRIAIERAIIGAGLTGAAQAEGDEA